MGIDVLAKPVEHCDEAEQAGEVDRHLRPEETLPVERGAVAQQADKKGGHECGHQNASQAAAQSAREKREEKEALLYPTPWQNFAAATCYLAALLLLCKTFASKDI